MHLKHRLLTFIIFTSLVACGGGDSGGDGSGGNGGGDGASGLSCNYDLPPLEYLNVDLTITHPHEKAPVAGTVLSIWHNVNSGGILQGKRSTGSLYTFDDGSWSYSVNSQDKTAEIWMSNSSGEETYTLKATSPTKGTWSSVSKLNSDPTSYVSKGDFDLPSYITACLDLDTSNSKVSVLDKSLSSEEESYIADGRYIDKWLVTPALSEQGTYVFTTNTNKTVLGIYKNDVKSNEVTLSSSLMGLNGRLSGSNIYPFKSGDSMKIEPYTVENQFFDDTVLIKNPMGGWLYHDPNGSFHSIDKTGVVNTLSAYYGSPLSNGKFAAFNTYSRKLSILDDDFNEVCSSTHTYGDKAQPSFGGTVVEGYLRNNYYKSFVEDDNGYIYMAITDLNAARIYVTKWDTSCNQIWSTSQSIYTYGASPAATVFKITGDYIYFAYQDKFINLYEGDGSGRVRFTFSRFSTSNGMVQIIEQWEARSYHEAGYTFDVVEDANGDLILAHGDTIEKIDGETFESIISYKFDGYQPLVPLNFRADGNLEVNNQFVVDKSLL
ncbi:MAG: hypothetical protein HRU20_19845 [Pseudomonadales bacterium]|nr:hypothetical protein [Pseudomonadales bacterium]